MARLFYVSSRLITDINGLKVFCFTWVLLVLLNYLATTKTSDRITVSAIKHRKLKRIRKTSVCKFDAADLSREIKGSLNNCWPQLGFGAFNPIPSLTSAWVLQIPIEYANKFGTMQTWKEEATVKVQRFGNRDKRGWLRKSSNSCSLKRWREKEGDGFFPASTSQGHYPPITPFPFIIFAAQWPQVVERISLTSLPSKRGALCKFVVANGLEKIFVIK